VVADAGTIFTTFEDVVTSFATQLKLEVEL
jgi:hypothetical protein